MSISNGPMDPLAAIRAVFFQECEEQLAKLEAGLLAMEAGGREPETVNAVFRAVHSIKGGAGAFGLDDLVRFAHAFETVLDDLRTARRPPDTPLLASMLRATDVLADLVRASRDGGVVDEERIAQSIRALEQRPELDDDLGVAFTPVPVTLADEPTSSPSAGSAVWTIRFRPFPELYAKANDPLLLLRELGRLGHLSASLDTTALPALSELDPEGAYLAWTLTLETASDEAEIREVFEFVEGDCELTVTRTGAPPPILQEPSRVASSIAPLDAAPPSSTIRVDLERVDTLIDLVGELVINQAMLVQRVEEAGLARSSATALALDQSQQLTRDIQDGVMAIRAQPVKSVFQRMPRLVREVAAAVGKSVRLVTEGEGTEVDKTVIERLNDPLTHMIRNAVDHGLETPEARLAAGKPAEGTVRLSAAHRSGRIVIEVADDGRGIDRARVKAKAIENGVIAADAILSDEEIDNLIFMPGFSTAAALSDISGRGVGMDVVKRSLQGLGGRIAIQSRPGEGSTFTMSLPLTLAVLDGMVVSVAGQTLIMPMTAIVETLQPHSADIRGMGDRFVIGIRNVYVPLVDVGVTLGYRAEAIDPTCGVALLVESEGGAQTALVVDGIQGQSQVVIKSLGANYREVAGIAAATILGDGQVALILDVDALVATSRGDPARTERTCGISKDFAMTSPQQGGTDPIRERTAFRIGSQEFCIDIRSVREIRGWTPPTPLPHAPDYVRGVINLRGTVLPIVDLAARFGLEPAHPTVRPVIIVAEIGGRIVGLVVDAVSDILTVDDSLIQPTPDVASDLARAFVRGVLAVDGRMISVLSLDRILPAVPAEASTFEAAA